MFVFNEMLDVVLNDLASEAICETNQKLKDYQTLLHFIYIFSHIFLNSHGTAESYLYRVPCRVLPESVVYVFICSFSNQSLLNCSLSTVISPSEFLCINWGKLCRVLGFLKLY